MRAGWFRWKCIACEEHPYWEIDPDSGKAVITCACGSFELKDKNETV